MLIYIPVILTPRIVSSRLVSCFLSVCVLGEILGYQGENDKMVAAIETARQRFDDLALSDSPLPLAGEGTDPPHQQQQTQPQRISRHSLASVYHKLATSYLTTRELIPLSLPLLDKALDIAPGGSERQCLHPQPSIDTFSRLLSITPTNHHPRLCAYSLI